MLRLGLTAVLLTGNAAAGAILDSTKLSASPTTEGYAYEDAAAAVRALAVAAVETGRSVDAAPVEFAGVLVTIPYGPEKLPVVSNPTLAEVRALIGWKQEYWSRANRALEAQAAQVGGRLLGLAGGARRLNPLPGSRLDQLSAMNEGMRLMMERVGLEAQQRQVEREKAAVAAVLEDIAQDARYASADPGTRMAAAQELLSRKRALFAKLAQRP